MAPRLIGSLLKSPYVLLFLLLLILEFLTFGGTFKNAGFYLDDWATLSTMKFGPQNYFEMMQNLLVTDSKISIRPIQAVLFPSLYKLFGTNPYGYHLFNSLVAVLASYFFGLAIWKYLNRFDLACCAGALLLLFPTHDSTHYWVLCSAVTLSMLFYTVSLYLTVASAQTLRYWRLLWVFFFFALGLFNYEVLLPLGALNVFFAFGAIINSGHSRLQAFKYSFLTAIGLGSALVLLLCYQRMVVPLFGSGWMHSVSFSYSTMLSTITSGIGIYLPTKLLPYLFKLVSTMGSAPSVMLLACLFGVFASSFCVLVFAFHLVAVGRNDSAARFGKLQSNLYLLLVGALTTVLSYTIFGLNSEYSPSYEGLLSRVNAGGSVGAVLVVIALIDLLLSLFRQLSNRLLRRSSKLPDYLTAFILSAVMVLFSLCNYVQFLPWQVSWLIQKEVRESLRLNKAVLEQAKFVLLVGCPRYSCFAPVCDGVWDFGGMTQVILGRKDVKGTVVSDRLQVSGGALRDVSCGFVCAESSFEQAYLVTPTRDCKLITSAEALQKAVTETNPSFQPSKKVTDAWRN